MRSVFRPVEIEERKGVEGEGHSASYLAVKTLEALERL